MVIDKKLDLDKELEYFPDGSVSFAQNVVVSDDGLTIQNEPAIVNFLAEREFDLVGFVACNEEFVLFSSKNDIVRVRKDTSWKNCDTNWKWQGGSVFGTFSYNINNELIIAISERNPKSDCPLKVINLDRDYVKGYDKDDIYTLTPEIPQSNMVDVQYVQGDKIKKGKYNFFIKYFIGNNFETSWFPIGVPVFAYDNSKADKHQSINRQEIISEEVTDSSVVTKHQRYSLDYVDFYNESSDYTNDNIKLQLEINNVNAYTHYKLGFIINTNGGTEGRETNKFKITNTTVIIDKNSFPISVDDLTVNSFNISNINTMCNYKNRLYIANYKEENVNKVFESSKIDTSGIKVFYNLFDTVSNYVTYDIAKKDYNINTLKNQWKSVPGRGAVYNFFIHYVYPNGKYTDGYPISNISNYKEILEYGRVRIIPDSPYYPLNVEVSSNTTTDEIYAAIQQAKETYSTNQYLLYINESLEEFCHNNLGAKWFDVKHNWVSSAALARNENARDSQYLIELNNYYNSKGDVLYETPINNNFNVSKLVFTGIKMYPEFVGYFISYEEPEYISTGEGFLVKESGWDTNHPNLHSDLNFEYEEKYSEYKIPFENYKFYYPEFGIVGGNIKIDNLAHVATPDEPLHVQYETPDLGFNNTSYFPNVQNFKGRIFSVNNLDTKYGKVKVNDVKPIAPDTYNNLGREGYLKVNTEKFTLAMGYPIYLGLSSNKDIYLSKVKKLVSLGYIKYVNYENDDNTYTYGEEKVPYNYNFYNCFSTIFYFDRLGSIINTTDTNPIYANVGIMINDAAAQTDKYYPDTTTYFNRNEPHLNMIQYWHQSHYPLFLKEINNAPDTIAYSINSYRWVIDRWEVIGNYNIFNKVLSPKYVNDLYKLHPNYYDYTGKLIVNYDESLYQNNIEQYNKTIRRSDVLQSESVKTAWRYFRPENYKVITEDKGDIKNVVGIGNYLFAHCEHSLFLFDITDSLQALDKNVQLLQPDSFEVNYKEVFTADKGYGGLQDYVSWICDEFGYIFFDKSAQKIYRFDGGQLKDMSDGINNLIKGISAQSILFGNDRPRNRILANLRGTDDNVIISYNLLSNGWISTHSYVSNYNFIGLKDKVFLLNVEGSNLTINHYLETEFNKYSLPVGNIDNDGSFKSFVDVVFTNNSYNKIKVLDFITYIINKEPADNFELLQIEIFTNCCYSGVIDISQERKKVSEYKKPYYDFERWNFNYFRNVIDKIENGDIVDRISGRIHSYPQKVQRGYDNALMSGKYVVIRFSFKLMSKQVNVKDVQAYFKP